MFRIVFGLAVCFVFVELVPLPGIDVAIAAIGGQLPHCNGSDYQDGQCDTSPNAPPGVNCPPTETYQYVMGQQQGYLDIFYKNEYVCTTNNCKNIPVDHYTGDKCAPQSGGSGGP